MAIVFDTCKLRKMTADEVREIVRANPGHYTSEIYQRALRNKPGNHVVTVGEVDIEAVRQNKRVRTVRTVKQEDGQEIEIVSKELMDLEDGDSAHFYATRRGEGEIAAPAAVPVQEVGEESSQEESGEDD